VLVANNVPVITVDGPSGTGKGTLCSYLASWLDWRLLDSGALYRVLAFAAEQQELQLEDKAGIANLASNIDVAFSSPDKSEEITVILEGNDVSQLIRTEVCGKNASQLATYPTVREALLTRQREFRQLPGLVADGRDMGTVVFIDAKLKIFLTATPEERAQRRHKQLKQKGFSVNLAQLSADIAERDTRDSERTVSPLRPADEAVVIETTNLSIEVVIERVGALVRERMPDVV
jgi:cytidylate kinase